MKSFIEKEAFIDIYLEKGHFYLKFCENDPISLMNITVSDENWHEITATFIAQSMNLTEFELYINGISVENRILNSRIALKNTVFTEETQILIGFDENFHQNSDISLQNVDFSLKNSEIFSTSDYFRIGPFRLFSRALNPFEINLLYSISSNSGTVNFLEEIHEINWQMIYLSNLRFFELSQNRKEIKSAIFFTKHQIQANLSHFSQFLLIECQPNCEFFATKKKSDFFRNSLKNCFFKNKFEETEVFNKEFIRFLLNKTNSSDKAQGYYLWKKNGDHSNKYDHLIYHDFLKKKVFFNNNFVDFIAKSTFFHMVFEILEKTENRVFFMKIQRILLDLLEKSQFFAEFFESENLFKVFLEIYKKKADFFQMDSIENLMGFFCKKISFLSRNSVSFINFTGNSYYWLINSMKIAKDVLMDQDFYQVFLTKNLIRGEFFEVICMGLIDSNRNLFSK